MNRGFRCAFPGISATATAMEYAMRFESPMTKFSNVSVEVGPSAPFSMPATEGLALSGFAAAGPSAVEDASASVPARFGVVMGAACSAEF